MNNVTPITTKGENNSVDKFTSHLTETAGGNFLFVKLVLDQLSRGHLVIKSSFKVLPVCLSEVYLLECNLRFSSIKSYEKVQDILAVAAATLHPMTCSEIFHCLNALQSTEAVSWPEFVGRFNTLSGFLVRRGDDTVMFAHDTLREWLVNRKNNLNVNQKTAKFLCDERQGMEWIHY